MPAECEVGGCGVLAIGRCTTCSSAFCGTHQARESTGTKYVDLCSACRAASRAAEGAKASARKAANEPSMLREVIKAMTERDVGGFEDRTFRWETTTTITRSWRKPTEQNDVHEFVGAPAWPIGPLLWRERLTWKYDDKQIYRECGVTRAGAIVFMPAAVAADANHGLIAPLFDWVKRGYVRESAFDGDLRSVRSPDIRDKMEFEPGSSEFVASAVSKLDGIARAHGVDLAQTLGWSAELGSAIRA